MNISRAPYVGITDFTNIKEVEQMLGVFKQNLIHGSRRRLHVGVMMSYKTLRGIETKWEKVFPPLYSIAQIFSSRLTMNCLHFADYENHEKLNNTLSRAFYHCGSGINALQLDMIWPDPKEIAEGLRGRSHVEIVLQVGKNALDAAGNNPQAVIDRLRDYGGLIHYVLLDKSMGKGLGMDAVGLIPFAHAIRNNFPEIGLAAAGGLGPETIHLVEPLVRAFPDISIDAQGRLRPSGNAMDPIDWNMAGAYLAKALRLLR